MKPFLSTAFLLISGLATQVPTPRSCEFLPFHEGNLWFHELGNGAAMTIPVEGVEGVKGTPCWKVVSEEWLAVDDTGVPNSRTRSPQGDMEYGKPVLRMQLPMSDGVTFASFANDLNGSDIKGEHTVRGPVRVKVGGKSWDAFQHEARYESAKGESRSVRWLAIGVGIVEQEMSGPDGRLVCELVDARLRGKEKTEPQRTTKTRFCMECGTPLIPGKECCGPRSFEYFPTKRLPFLRRFSTSLSLSVASWQLW